MKKKTERFTVRLTQSELTELHTLLKESGVFSSKSHLVRTLLTEGLEVMTDRLSVD